MKKKIYCTFRDNIILKYQNKILEDGQNNVNDKIKNWLDFDIYFIYVNIYLYT